MDDAEFSKALIHYADAYYDPARAHAYYLATRHLLGRKQGLDKNQQIAESYVTNVISTDRKNDTAANLANEKSTINELRTTAKATSDQISETIDTLINTIVSKTQPVGLNKIPPNATPQLKAFLAKQNAIIVANAKKVAEVKLKKTSADLQTAITNAQTAYITASNAITAKYNSAQVTEDQNIRTHIK